MIGGGAESPVGHGPPVKGVMIVFQVRSNNWGPLLAETVTVEGPFVIMTGVTTWDGKPFKPVCWIPVSDVMLIVPESE